MDTVRSRIARNIKRLRIKQGLSVDDVGAVVGKSGKTVSAWEVGRGQPDADTLIELCRLFKVDVNAFYGATEQPSKDEEHLLFIYRSLNELGKQALLSSAEGLLKNFSEGR